MANIRTLRTKPGTISAAILKNNLVQKSRSNLGLKKCFFIKKICRYTQVLILTMDKC